VTTIHLTDAQRDTFAASGLIVINGEPCPQCDAEFRSMVTRETHRCSGAVAPEDWHILTEPCDTCKGSGVVGDMEGSALDCPHCIDGERIVTLTATCPTCDGGGCDSPCLGAHPDDGRPHNPCPTCGREGEVTLGRFTIPALLPVVDAHRMAPDVEPGGVVIEVAVGSLWMMPKDQPLPRPGQFVVRPERVA
jgi:hypothetical protein